MGGEKAGRPSCVLTSLRDGAKEGCQNRGNMCIFEGKRREIEGAHDEGYGC
jgi:hypothetical protein